MRKPEICHSQNTAFLDALESCLASGLTVVVDGIPQTKESLENALADQDGEGWIGTVLLNDKGDMKGLSFSKPALN